MSGGASSQLEDINNSLAEFYQKAAASVESYELPPQFSDYVDRMDYSDLLRRCTQDANGSATHTTAIAVEECHTAAAHVREHIMATRSKAELYAGIVDEYMSSNEYHINRGMLFPKILDNKYSVPYLE